METIRFIDPIRANRIYSWKEYKEWFKEIVSEKVSPKAVGCPGGGFMSWNYVEESYYITPEFPHQTDIKFDFNTHEVTINVR